MASACNCGRALPLIGVGMDYNCSCGETWHYGHFGPVPAKGQVATKGYEWNSGRSSYWICLGDYGVSGEQFIQDKLNPALGRWEDNNGQTLIGQSHALLDVPPGALLWSRDNPDGVAAQARYGPKTATQAAVKLYPPIFKSTDPSVYAEAYAKAVTTEALCPVCGPARGTMLRTTEANCWRCGWKR